ncbi:hypothetical protein [Amycolatopsis eburnea]|uniref:hypothetical protein n=1 Tax=Amycolatopsis eburnea TaxID=2267691 RepID=UPI001CDD85AA|nr:hypothetical protein [Amycolatopsis eburnea]
MVDGETLSAANRTSLAGTVRQRGHQGALELPEKPLVLQPRPRAHEKYPVNEFGPLKQGLFLGQGEEYAARHRQFWIR